MTRGRSVVCAATALVLVAAGCSSDDTGRATNTPQAAADQYSLALQAIVDTGPDAFDDAAVATVLSGAVVMVDALTQGECG